MFYIPPSSLVTLGGQYQSCDIEPLLVLARSKSEIQPKYVNYGNMQDAIVYDIADQIAAENPNFVLKAAEVPVSATFQEVLDFLAAEFPPVTKKEWESFSNKWAQISPIPDAALAKHFNEIRQKIDALYKSGRVIYDDQVLMQEVIKLAKTLEKNQETSHIAGLIKEELQLNLRIYMQKEIKNLMNQFKSIQEQYSNFGIVFAGLIDGLGYDAESKTYYVMEAKATNLGRAWGSNNNVEEREKEAFIKRRSYYFGQLIIYMAAIKNGHFPKEFRPIPFIGGYINKRRTMDPTSYWEPDITVKGLFVTKNTNEQMVENRILSSHAISFEEMALHGGLVKWVEMTKNMLNNLETALNKVSQLDPALYEDQDFYYTLPLVNGMKKSSEIENVQDVELLDYHNNSIHNDIRQLLIEYTPIRKAIQFYVSPEGPIAFETWVKMQEAATNSDNPINAVVNIKRGGNKEKDTGCTCSMRGSCPYAQIKSEILSMLEQHSGIDDLETELEAAKHEKFTKLMKHPDPGITLE